MIFNKDKLQEQIIETWGEFGAHNEVFKAMRNQISDLKQLTLTGVSNSYTKEDVIKAYDDGFKECYKQAQAEQLILSGVVKSFYCGGNNRQNCMHNNIQCDICKKLEKSWEQ